MWTIIFCVFSIVYMIPTYFKTIGPIYMAYEYVLPIISIPISFYCILKSRKRIIQLLMFFFYFWIVISTIIHNGEVIDSIKTALTAIGYISLVGYVFQQKNANDYLNVLSGILCCFAVLNLLTVVIFPKGLYLIYGYNEGYSNPAYVFGHRNNAIEYLLPLIGLVLYRDICNGKKKAELIFVIAVSVITSLLTWSVNALLCLAFVIVSFLFLSFKKNLFFIRIPLLFLSSGIVSYLLIIKKIRTKYAYLITSILHKDITLSSRSVLWENGIEWIKKSLVFGYGFESRDVFFQKIGHMSSCHNYFLDFMYFGGSVLVLVIVVILILLSTNLAHYDNTIISRVSSIYGAYAILWIATPVHRESLFIMFAFITITVYLPFRKSKTNRGVFYDS